MKPKLVTLWVNLFIGGSGNMSVSMPYRTKRESALNAKAMSSCYHTVIPAVKLCFHLGVKRKGKV